MDDTRFAPASRTPPPRSASVTTERDSDCVRVDHAARRTRRLLLLLVLFPLAAGLSGCSLFVMAGKMFFGDPKVKSQFRSETGVDLAKEEKQVLVIFSTPDLVKSEFPSIEFDLTEKTTRQLKRRGINVVDPDDVARFIDDHGGYWENVSQLAREFHVDVIVHVDLDLFTCKEENSPWLLRGRAEGNVYGYRVKEVNGERLAREIFVHEFSSTHPRNTPVSPDQMSAEAFQNQYIDLVATQIAQVLHDYRASELAE